MSAKASRKRRRKKVRRASLMLIIVSAVLGAALIGGSIALKDTVPLSLYVMALLIAAGVFLLLPLCFLKRRRLSHVVPCLILGALLYGAAMFVHLSSISVGWVYVSRYAQSVDLSGQELTDISPLQNMFSLKEAHLSGNQLTEADALTTQMALRFVDLTGNPITAEAQNRLLDSLPDCLILSEAPDDRTARMDLGRYPLPDTDTLIRVFTSHTALTEVDCRQSALADADIDRLRAEVPGVNFLATVMVDGKRCSSDDEAVTIPAKNFEDAIALLSRFTAPKEVTFTGGVALTPREYFDTISHFSLDSLTADITVFGRVFPKSATALDFVGVDVDATLLSALPVFEQLTAVTLGEEEPALVRQLRTARPDLSFSYTYFGQTLSDGTEELDLRGLEIPDPDTLRTLKGSAPLLKTVYMDTPAEESWPLYAGMADEVMTIYSVYLPTVGKTLSTDTQVIDFGSRTVSDSQVVQLAEELKLLPCLTDVLMYQSRLKNSSMDVLYDGFPEVFFGWTISFGKYTMRTDITAFSTLKSHAVPFYTNDDIYPLRYCKKLQALDLGHNVIRDLSFLTNFPHLKVLILADNRIHDISPLASLEELEYVELFLNYITDLSPLANHMNLIDLNICHNPRDASGTIRDVSPLLTLTNLRRLWCSYAIKSSTLQKQLTNGLPGCRFYFEGYNSTAGGWREIDRYYVIYEMFRDQVYRPFELGEDDSNAYVSQ